MNYLSIKSIAVVVGTLAMAFSISYIVLAVWQEPTASPPGSNVPAPINVGGDWQQKIGSSGQGGIQLHFSSGSPDPSTTDVLSVKTDASNTAIYGESASGFAGYFTGKGYFSSDLTVGGLSAGCSNVYAISGGQLVCGTDADTDTTVDGCSGCLNIGSEVVDPGGLEDGDDDTWRSIPTCLGTDKFTSNDGTTIICAADEGGAAGYWGQSTVSTKSGLYPSSANDKVWIGGGAPPVSADDTSLSVTNDSANSAIYAKQKGSGYAGYFDGGDTVFMNGKVGIGTETPQAKLDVDGAIKVDTSASRIVTDTDGFACTDIGRVVSGGKDDVCDSDHRGMIKIIRTECNRDSLCYCGLYENHPATAIGCNGDYCWICLISCP